MILTVEQFCEREGIDFDPTNVKALRAVQDAEAFVTLYTGETFTTVTDDEVTLDGLNRYAVLLPHRPTIEVTSVTTLDNSSVETLLEGTSYRVDEADILWRLDGDVFESGPANVVVVYTHGYETPPADVVAAVYALASQNYVAAGGGAVVSQQIMSYQVQYDSSTVGSAELPDDVKFVLDHYRNKR